MSEKDFEVYLYGNYYVRADENQWMLSQLTQEKPRKIWKNLAYYSKIESMCSGVIERVLRSRKVKDKEDMLKEFKQLRTAVLRLKGILEEDL